VWGGRQLANPEVHTTHFLLESHRTLTLKPSTPLLVGACQSLHTSPCWPCFVPPNSLLHRYSEMYSRSEWRKASCRFTSRSGESLGLNLTLQVLKVSVVPLSLRPQRLPSASRLALHRDPTVKISLGQRQHLRRWRWEGGVYRSRRRRERRRRPRQKRSLLYLKLMQKNPPLQRQRLRAIPLGKRQRRFLWQTQPRP